MDPAAAPEVLEYVSEGQEVSITSAVCNDLSAYWTSRLAEQRDNEIFAHQLKQQASDKKLPGKRRRLEKSGVYGSIAAVPSISSDRSRDS